MMVLMSYRFEILTEEDIWEGWAHTSDEMRQRFLDEQKQDCEVFLYGSCPKWFNLDEYRTLKAEFSDRAILVLDSAFGRFLAENKFDVLKLLDDLVATDKEEKTLDEGLRGF